MKSKEEIKKFYQKVYDYLIKTRRDFCFTAEHGIVSREDCSSYLLIN
jgi:hypothetical protein